VIRPVTEPSHAVFLSYASQDAEPAQRICEALRAAGIEVWFDQSELRGGDAWDQSIRKQIKTCALFLPVISHTTHDRREGYFRLEWKLAVDRCHLMDADMAFLLPVVIDDTRDDDERVPERFREVQWTRLPGGVTPAAFVERVRRLLSGELSQAPTGTESAAARVSAAPKPRQHLLASWRSKAALLMTIAVVVVALGYLVANRLVLSKRSAEVGGAPVAQSAPAPVAVFNPPPHSIAVLPFVNMSADKEQEYFSDGLTEELLDSLARINELQVAARTSAFSFKGKDTDIGTIARKLNVGAVLEGSVRRSERTVRVTTQLINAVTGFHMWSQTYDHDLGDVLKLETEIANAVTSALKVNLLGNAATKPEPGGTHNPAAFDAYLRGRKAYLSQHLDQHIQIAIADYSEAIRADSNYALAFANRSLAFNRLEAPDFAAVERIHKAQQQDALKAVSLAPDLADGHLALAIYFAGALDLSRADEEYERAWTLAPGDARVLRDYAGFAIQVGRKEAGIAAARRSVILDPLDGNSHDGLGWVLYSARQYQEAIAAWQGALALDPDDANAYGFRGLAYYALGNWQRAQATCESKAALEGGQWCLTVVYDKLGRHADAEAVLAKLTESNCDNAPYACAQVYAQWGNTDKALGCLEKALRLQDGGLQELKVDMLLDPLRKEPRFQAIERELKFPS
jgi:TolB-like protein/tetratricopeptide (TPR) repeat protein